jgi:AcrR family transcriptional regulator
MKSNQIIFTKIFSSTLSKADLKKKEIIEATARLGGQYGLEACTFDFIAKEVGSTRPLLNHYFKNREALFEITAEYVRLTIQQKVLEKIEHMSLADEMLVAYIKANLNWINDNPEHLKFWAHFMMTSTYNENHRNKNTEYVRMGLMRITELINLGMNHKRMKLHFGDTESAARSIQLLITGALLSFATENYTSKEQLEREKTVIILSCSILGIDLAKLIFV